MSTDSSPMPGDRRSMERFGIWGLISSGVGYHLDNFGRWLTFRVPWMAVRYAAMLAPGIPALRPCPGWRFAGEFYVQRLWMACRRGALWEAAMKHDPTTSLLLKWYDGATVEVTLGNDNSLCLYVCGSFEPNEFFFLDGFLKPGMVFVDVGANDGYYSLFAARRVGVEGKVVAVEPSTRERINLRRNLSRNGFQSVRVVAAALGAIPGEADLQLAQGVHSGQNTLGRFVHDNVEAVNLERVTLKTLDQVAAELGLTRIDFVKIDVEGAEALVVSGARSVLMSMQPLILMEINADALSAQGVSAQSFLEKLQAEFGYEILVFSSTTGRPEATSRGGGLSSNILAVPKSRLSEILTAN